MSNYKFFSAGTPGGVRLKRALQSSDDADRWLKQERDTMVQMFEGDGSLDAHYTTIVAQYGFASTADAHAAFLVIDTAFQKTSGGASDTSGARAARDLLFSQLRN